MIYTAPSIMFWMRAYPFRGQVGGGGALEIESFLGPVKWHRSDRRLPFGAQKTRTYSTLFNTSSSAVALCRKRCYRNRTVATFCTGMQSDNKLISGLPAFTCILSIIRSVNCSSLLKISFSYHTHNTTPPLFLCHLFSVAADAKITC